MAGVSLSPETERIVAGLRRFGGNIKRTAGFLGCSRQKVRYHRGKAIDAGVTVPTPPWDPTTGESPPPGFQSLMLEAEVSDKPVSAGRVDVREVDVRPLPAPGQVKSYILTAAVNNWDIHGPYWQNLCAYARYLGAEILVRPLAYNLNAFRRMGADTELMPEGYTDSGVYYDPAVLPFLSTDRVELAPGLHWAGDAPVTATAVRPLSGYETFTGEASGIFGATKVEMRSVATMVSEPAKLVYSTGVVTQRAYSETKTGQKADFHHTYGALIAEVESDGTWFVRHLLGSSETGAFDDLDLHVEDGRVVASNDNVAGLTPGDIHSVKLDPRVKDALFGEGGMIDQIRPQQLHLHDLHDHESRSHHIRKDPFKNLLLHETGQEGVEREVEVAAELLKFVARQWMKTVVVKSNHDNHLLRWVKEADWKTDPANMEFYLSVALRMVQATKQKEDGFDVLEWACRNKGAPAEVVFLRPDQDWRLEGIQCGLHGDQGLNGARGSAASIARTGSKTNIGHSHSAGIWDGCWQSGVTGGDLETIRMDYVSGPSSWSRSMIVTYKGGKRSMVTMRGLKFRADRSRWCGPEGAPLIAA
jgi:hypothetical protein